MRYLKKTKHQLGYPKYFKTHLKGFKWGCLTQRLKLGWEIFVLKSLFIRFEFEVNGNGGGGREVDKECLYGRVFLF